MVSALRPLPVLVLLVATLSGCVGEDDAPPTSGALTSGPAPSSSAPGSVSTSSGGPSPPGGPPTSATPPPPPRSETFAGNIALRVLPVLGPIVDAPVNEHATKSLVFDGNITGYVIDLTWSAFTPLSTALGLWVRKGANDPGDFIIEGASPLRLAVAANLTTGGTYTLDVVPSDPAGAAVNQAFTLVVTVFDGAPFDPAWTATP